MRCACVALLFVALAGCRDKYSVGEAQYDPSLLTSSGGEVALSDGSSFDYAITSDRYRQWDAARKGFSRTVSGRFGDILRPAAPTERSIQRAISYLEGQQAVRASIERAGMTVRDFVLMTVALEQQMRLATQRREMPEMTQLPPATDTFALDTARSDTTSTTYLPGDLGPRYPYTPLPVDSPRRVDTVYLPARDSLPRRDTLRPRRDTLRPDRVTRDTAKPPRDTIAPPRDTSQPRDTLPAPPDSLGQR
jgi:hypothetical protein